MIKNKELYESLSNFIDAVASEDGDSETNSIKEYINEKTKSQLEGDAPKKYTLEGDDVMCDGKKCGTITSDDGTDSKITFKDEDGKSMDFDSLPKLYAHLGKGDVKEGAKDGMVRAKDAVSTPKPAKSERAKRFDSVRNKTQSDGKAGEYDKNDPRSSEHQDTKKK